MWNMRSPPFRYSITKNRFSWTQKCKEVRAVVLLRRVEVNIYTRVLSVRVYMVITLVWKVQ